MFDKVKGTIFGNAIGDALGLGAEFMTKEEVKQFYPEGLERYEQIVQGKHSGMWNQGEWSDDAEQMICILDSLIENNKVDVVDIAKRFHNWMITDGRGIGYTTHKVLSDKDFLDNPQEVAKKVWIESGQHLAPNGALMRTSPLGIWKYSNKDEVIRNATEVCKITHFDDRCVASCVLTCHAISLLIQGKDKFEVFEEVLRLSKFYDKRVYSSLEGLKDKNVEELELNSEDSIGYTLKALAAGFWALLHADTFKDGIVKIINEGGDADTNGAVAGALLGAAFGFSNIPEEYVKGLIGKEALCEKLKRFKYECR